MGRTERVELLLQHDVARLTVRQLAVLLLDVGLHLGQLLLHRGQLFLLARQLLLQLLQ